MNLKFEGGNGQDFPFQTPTTLTYAVLAAPTKAERLKLIDDAMSSWGWTHDERHERLQVIIDQLEAGARLTMI